MPRARHQRGRMQWPLLALAGSVAMFCGLIAVLAWPRLSATPSGAAAEPLLVHCAVAFQAPLEEIARQYEAEFQVRVQLQFGSSQSLLSGVDVARVGDLFLPAEEDYIALARERDLVAETLPLATLRPVLAVPRGNPLALKSLADVVARKAKFAQAQPDAAAIGKITRTTLQQAGTWTQLEAATTVFKENVHAVATDIKVGAIDAGVVWDSTLPQFPTLEAVEVPEFTGVSVSAAVAVLQCSRQPTQALHFARYLAASDRGLPVLQRMGYTVAAGDPWVDQPTLTLYAGALLRPAIEKTLAEFETREGVRVVTVYNGCGILVGQMKSGNVPDAYFACDRSFMVQVRDLFASTTVVSSNELVILVPLGNPRNIRKLADLAQEGLRVGVGHEQQCALGQLTAETFRKSGVSEQVEQNIRVRVPSGDMLVNQLRAQSLDAVVAYLANAVNCTDLEAVRIPDLPCAIAYQPLGVAKASSQKRLAERLQQALLSPPSRERFLTHGFVWGERRP